MDNIPRVLPKKCDVADPQRVVGRAADLSTARARGGVEEAELYQVFNMGIGMTVIVAADKADAALRFIRARRSKPPGSSARSSRGTRQCQEWFDKTQPHEYF